MKSVSILLEDYLYAFYEKLGAHAGGIPVEQVLADALFRMAGELALQVLPEERK